MVLDSQMKHMKAKAVKTIFSHLSLFSGETPYFVIFPYIFPTLALLRRSVHPINVSSMNEKLHLACPQHSMSRFQSAGRHENIHKRSINVPRNKPHHFWINSSPRTSTIGHSRNIPCLATMGPSYCWCMKGITLVESLTLGLDCDCQLSCPAHWEACRRKDCKGSLSPKPGSILPQAVDGQPEKKVMAYVGRVLPSDAHM